MTTLLSLVLSLALAQAPAEADPASSSTAPASDAPAAASQPDCGWAPEVHDPEPTRVRYPQVGCGLAPKPTQAAVAELKIVAVELGKKQTRIHFVLLNKQKQRLLLPAAKVRYRVALKKKFRGNKKLKGLKQTDGVYLLTLPPSAPPKPCALQIVLKLADKPAVEGWVDDWMYGC